MIRFLMKGLLRDPSRSRFPVIMVAVGTFLTVLLYSWMQGVLGDLVRVNAQFDTGHVKIMTRAYRRMADQAPNDLALLGVEDLLSELRRAEPGMLWTPRIRFGGLLDIPDAKGETRTQGPAVGFGVDLLGRTTPEPEILNLKASLVRGRLPESPGEILLSDAFARKLEVMPGQDATLIGATMNGAMAMQNFKVAGTVEFGVSMMDRGAVIADIADVQAALDMRDAAGEITGYRPDMIYADRDMAALTAGFNKRFSRADDEYAPVMLSLREQNGLDELLDLAEMVGLIIVAIFVAAMSIVLWNAALMNGLRRYGEIGVRLAMGEPKNALVGRMVVESIMIGIAGSILGTAIGLAASYYLQIKGLDISSMMRNATMIAAATMRARVTWISYVLGFMPGLFAPVLGTLFAGVGIYRRQTSQLFKELEV